MLADDEGLNLPSDNVPARGKKRKSGAVEDENTPQKSKAETKPPTASQAKGACRKQPTGKRHETKGLRAAAQRTVPTDGKKKCKDCKGLLDLTEFWMDQAVCKSCSRENRNLLNMAKNQDCLEWYKSLSEKEKSDLGKAYRKAKKKAESERSKMKFSMKAYRESIRVQQGARMERRRRAMTEAQWMRHAVEEEDMTRLQAETRWKEMLLDSSFVKEGAGAKTKIYVPIHNDMLDYDDVGQALNLSAMSLVLAEVLFDC